MPDQPRPLAHLLRGAEELLRAGAEATAILRERTDAQTEGPVDDWIAGLLRLARSADASLLPALENALEREATRWRAKADDDRAARRVMEFFDAALDLLRDDQTQERPRNVQNRRAPRRGFSR